MSTSSYKPSAYYFRKALRLAQSQEEAVEIGMQAVREVEHLKKFIRSLGIIPPRKFILSTEADEKKLITFPLQCSGGCAADEIQPQQQT